MKKSKRKWARTEAKKRKDWSINHTSYYSGGAPKWFCKIFHNSDKRRLQKYLSDIEKGADPDEVFYNPRYNNKGANWYWY